MSDIVNVSYQSLQIFRIFSGILLLTCNISIMYFFGLKQGLLRQIIYLTKWGHNLEIIYFIMMFIETSKRKGMKVEMYEIDMNKHFLNSLHSTLLSGQFVITFFYWIIIFDPASCVDFFSTFRRCYYHLVPLLLISIEFFWNSLQIRNQHLKMIVIFFILYMMVNMTYVLISGISVYDGLDFKNMGSFWFVVQAVLTAFLGFFIFRGLEFFKWNLRKKKLLLKRRN